MSYAVTDTGIGVTWGEGDKGQLGHSLQRESFLFIIVPTAFTLQLRKVRAFFTF